MRITLLFLLSCTFHNENFYTTEGHETREPKQDKETDGEGSRPQTVKWLREDQVSSACVRTGAGKDSARVLRKKWTNLLLNFSIGLKRQMRTTKPARSPGTPHGNAGRLAWERSA